MMNFHLPQRQLIDELLQMNDEAVKCIEGHAASADNLVSSLMSSTTKLKLPSNVSKRLEELSKSMDESVIAEDQAKMSLASSNQECDCEMEDATDVDDASMTSASPTEKSTKPSMSEMSEVDGRPIKRRRSTDHLCKKSKEANQRVPPEYDEGMLVYPNPLLIDDHLHDCPEVLSVLLFNIGQLQLQRHQEDVALRFFQLANDVPKSSSDDSQLSSSEHHLRSQLAILHQVAYTHFRKKDYPSALVALKQVLNTAEQNYGHHHLSTASALHCIGTVMFHLRNKENQEMLQVLKRALTTRKLILGSRHKDVATTLNNIGRIYFDCGEIENALSYYEEALQIRQDLFGENHVDVAATTFNIGQAHHRMGHLEEALSRYSKFYSFISIFGSRDQHRDEVVALKHMGQVYQEQKNMAEARSCYQEAINVSIMACGQEQEKETASILNMYGNMLYEAGSFDKAAEV